MHRRRVPLARDRGVAGAEVALGLRITDPSACHLRERSHCCVSRPAESSSESLLDLERANAAVVGCREFDCSLARRDSAHRGCFPVH
jgi:hypothetical protein